MKHQLIFALILLLGSCSKDVPPAPDPEEPTLIGRWTLSQHIWGNGVVSDSACVDFVVHLDLAAPLWDWDHFMLELGGRQSVYVFSYSTPYGPVEHLYPISWDLPIPDTLSIDDGHTNPSFKYDLSLEGTIEILRLEDVAGRWILRKDG